MSKVLPPVLILIGFLISTAVLPRFLPLGVMFDVGLVLIVCYGLAKGEIKGAMFGLALGLVYGLLMSGFFGFFALTGFAAGFASGFFRDDERSLVVTILIVLGVVFVYQIVSYVGQAVLLGEIGFMRTLHRVVLPKTILTTLLIVPVNLFSVYIRRRFRA